VLFNLFFNGELSEVPDALTLRTETYTMLLIGIVALSFVFIAFSRMSNSKSLQTVIGVFFMGYSIDQELKENMRLNSISSILLFFNYIVSFSLCVFIFLNRIVLFDVNWSFLFSFSIPLLFFVLETLGLFMVGWITGEQKSINSSVAITITGYHFTGLLLSVLSIFWIMNPDFNKLFLGIFISILCLKYMSRFLKNSAAVLSSGVSWYYLILYFCTLEILPLFVVYYYGLKDFLK
jgi:hypothetical protein